jgi:nucleoside-diphosphate-sugar epimerase
LHEQNAHRRRDVRQYGLSMDVVTGATGFVGPHLVAALVARGRTVRCLVRDAARGQALAGAGVEVRVGALSDARFVADGLAGAERVFHLAGGGRVSTASDEGLAELRAANVAPLRAVLSAAGAARVQRIVHFSSISSMGVQLGERVDEDSPCRPCTPHEIAKYESEEAALEAWRQDGIPVVVLRPSQIYGPGDLRSEIPRLVRLAARGWVPLFDGGRGRVPWVYVADVVDAALLAASAEGAAGRTYVVSDADSYVFADVVAVIARSLGRRRGGVAVPRRLAAWAIGGLEKAARMLGREPPFTLHRLASMCGARLLSIDRARRELGYRPRVGLEEGMSATVAFYRREGWV